MEKEKVLLGLSGGVDSSVAALILKDLGYEVIGVTMKIWGKRKNLALRTHSGTHKSCFSPNEEENIEETRKLAHSLGIPYEVIDCSEEYEKIVLDNFKSEYLEGKTPNPCVLCNTFIKFGALPDLARKKGVEFDKFATGHYARIEKRGDNYILKKGLDESKDQSYFLYRLTQNQLRNIIFPLGGYKKQQIRELALKYGLITASKPDSQDFFSGSYSELLNLQNKEGNIVDKEGKILGTHQGIWNYTIGQRKGLKVSSFAPLYVLELRSETNEVVVGNIDDTFKKSLTATNLNWINGAPKTEEFRAEAKIRSSGKTASALVRLFEDKISLEFDEYQKSITKGQSLAIYKGDILLGGGIITGT